MQDALQPPGFMPLCDTLFWDLKFQTKTIVDLDTAVEENDLAAIQKYLIKDVDIDTRLMVRGFS